MTVLYNACYFLSTDGVKVSQFISIYFSFNKTKFLKKETNLNCITKLISYLEVNALYIL